MFAVSRSCLRRCRNDYTESEVIFGSSLTHIYQQQTCQDRHPSSSESHKKPDSDYHFLIPVNLPRSIIVSCLKSFPQFSSDYLSMTYFVVQRSVEELRECLPLLLQELTTIACGPDSGVSRSTSVEELKRAIHETLILLKVNDVRLRCVYNFDGSTWRKDFLYFDPLDYR